MKQKHSRINTKKFALESCDHTNIIVFQGMHDAVVWENRSGYLNLKC